MRIGLHDITLYAYTPHSVGTPGFDDEMSLRNFICDFYLQKMNGYKPPKATRVTIRPKYHGQWPGPIRRGSIVSVAPYFNYDEFVILDTKGRYRYVLDVIHAGMMMAGRELGWDIAVLENAYITVLEAGFIFRIEYPFKMSRNGKNKGRMVVEKTQLVTSAFVEIEIGGKIISKKLFDKKNSWFYDCIYILAGASKWFDSDRFGFRLLKGTMECWYSVQQDRVAFFESGKEVQQIDFREHFTLQ